MHCVFSMCIALLAILSCYATAAAVGDLDGPPLDAARLAVVVNTNDPQSVDVAAYYQSKRRIAKENIVRISMRSDRTTLSATEFAAIKAEVDRQTPSQVQAFALTWLRPYRVDCMSITAAFAFGFSKAFCSEGCRPTRFNSYFDSEGHQPAVTFGLRPTMSIAARSLREARALIDRGVAADGTAPQGTAYLVSTSDKFRNVRSPRYRLTEAILSDKIAVKRVDGEALTGANDVMFYFIGAARVPNIRSNRFLPGAVADHLTSTGGHLLGTSQMSSLSWLEAGATGSYGAVVEPCNFTTKFPDPPTLMKHYLYGDTLIEAYWKSVAMPGQGLFIGEPLARPYAPRAN